ncbi:dnaJ homolog subfamily C member 30, mitochondrial [Drosophila novamexicana]|uniref:dnaJ homolog subfamily C member 30, mitochondrial n=1 Tax=Drosophila novamexicana TaxID=47314 RepID=UPI0011E593E4|nr:dnaJ homolog subfamily C member 30, mitochondrial [Drosophila novamexicana]
MLYHGQLLCRLLTRCLHTTHAQWQLNHYDALGIGKRSTQNEIKAAYYKLSMIYHPDRNKGSESAAKKFREISQAYEVLGNFRLRRLYDKGIVHTAGAQYAQDIPDVEVKVEDDAETKFYKSRFKKSKVADAEGRTPIYDFDEWSRAHYGKSFERRQATQAKHERLRMQKEQSRVSIENDLVMFAFIFAGIAMYLMFMAETSYDTPKRRAEDRYKQDQDQKAVPVATSTDEV